MKPSSPPGPKRRFPGEHVLAMRRDPLGFMTRLAARYGDVARVSLGGEPLYLVSDPELIRDILVTKNRSFVKGRALERSKILLGESLLTSNGDYHLRQRRLAQPAFHRARIAEYGATMVEYAERAQREWREGERRDIAQAMTHLTLAIAGRALFDAEVTGEAREIGEAMTVAIELFDLVTVPFAELFMKLPLPRARRFRQAKALLDATIYRIIAERRRAGEDRGDLLSMLMLARDEDGDGGAMTDEQLRDEALTLFLAGHETTANALAWTWYLLSRNPAAEALLHAELDTVLGDQLPTMEDLPRLAYTRMVLAEAMRLYPPAWIIGRRTVAEVEVGDYRIPAGSLVAMSQWVVHRDARWWPEPERFDPARWTPGAESSRPKFSYFPFGGGPRLCIGEQFAWAEGILLIASIARRWRLRRSAGVVVEPLPLITLRPKGGVTVELKRRMPLIAPALVNRSAYR
jgi:cytochrome P450